MIAKIFLLLSVLKQLFIMLATKSFKKIITNLEVLL